MDSNQLDQDYENWKYKDHAEQDRQDQLWRIQHPWRTVFWRLSAVLVAVLFWIWFFKRVL